MNCCKRLACCCLTGLSCRVFGVLALAFVTGTAVGMFLPIGAVAIVETALLLLLAYLCLFKW